MMKIFTDYSRCPVCNEYLEVNEWEEPVWDNYSDSTTGEFLVRAHCYCPQCGHDYDVIEHYEYIGHEAPIDIS